MNYATYNVTVTGYTNAGNGPGPEKFASKKTFTFTEKWILLIQAMLFF